MKKLLHLIIILLSFTVNSQNIFKDDLSTYVFANPLHGQGLWSHNNDALNGGFGAGACNPVVSGQGCLSANILINSISYPNYGSSTNSLEIAPFLDNPGHPLTPVVTNGELFVGMVLNIATAPAAASASDFFRAANGDTTLITFRLIIKDAGTGYNIGIRKGASNNLTVYSSTIYSYNQDNLIILKYSHKADPDDDILSLFVNPDYANGEPVVAEATTSNGIDQSGNIDRIFFRLGFNNATALPTGFAGLVSASTTWAGLGFIPLGIDEFDSEPLTILSNNVKNGTLTINSNRSINNAKLNIYSITGQLLENQNISLTTSSNEIRINAITSPSVYIVELIEPNGKKQVQKIIIN